jgi:hypothetical protein
MKMTTLYAALSGAFLLGAATLVPAQTTGTTAGTTADTGNSKSVQHSEKKAAKNE